MDFIYKSGLELAELIRDGKATSLEVTRAHLDQIKKHNDQLNAVVILNEEEAIQEAKACDEEAASGKFRGKFHGVPMTIKEQFWLKGEKATINFKHLKDWVAPEDAVVVQRLKSAGAIILGKTNVPKQLLDYQVWGDIYPEGKNPYDSSRTPGGSSGGAAAALASGMVPLELGGDFGGSVRIPSHFCGIYGLRPTANTIPPHGLMPQPEEAEGHIFKMGTAGPMARTIEDMEALWEILKGPHPSERIVPPVDWKDVSDKSLQDYKIAWIDRWPEFEPSNSTQELIKHFSGQLKGKVQKIENTGPAADLHMRCLKVWYLLMGKLLAQDLPWYIRLLMRWDIAKRIGKGLKKFSREYKKGYSLSFSHYSKVMGKRAEAIEEWEQYFEKYDILICPMSYGPAYKRLKMGKPIETEEGQLEYMNYCFPYVACFNTTGHPSLNLPLGVNEEGLPIGVQIVGPYWSEPDLIQFVKLVGDLTDGFVPPKGYTPASFN